MKLITEKLKQRFAEIGQQRENDNPIIVAKFFNPWGLGIWYVASFNEEQNTCFGYEISPLGEMWCEFSIDEIESFQLRPFGPIERDNHFKEKLFSELKQQKKHNR